MAQTKRKRRTKHRGNAAGVVEVRGRTGRPPTPEERKRQQKDKARQARVPKAPTWNTAVKKGLFAALGLFLVLLILDKGKVVPALALGVIATLLYIPSGYYMDSYIYRRHIRKHGVPR